LKGAEAHVEVSKSTRGMPRLSEAKKDAISCDKLGGEAHTRYIPRFPNGATPCVEDARLVMYVTRANAGN
jgi:hypothetical protein